MKIPKMTCKQGCSDCCGVVPFTNDEMKAANAIAPLVVFATLGGGVNIPAAAMKTGNCPFIASGGGCQIYAVRPVVCRLFGVVDHELMTCPHGCGPKRKLTNAQAQSLMKSNPLAGCG